MSDGDDAKAPTAATAPTGSPPNLPSVSPLGPPSRPPLRQRLSELFAEYGRIAIATYFTLSILTIIGFSVAIGIGAEPSSATGVIGVIAAGWVAAKATLPIRILITLGLTPMVAFVVTRRGPKPLHIEPLDQPADGQASVPGGGDADQSRGHDPVHRAP
jgi:hypothetical protein